VDVRAHARSPSLNRAQRRSLLHGIYAIVNAGPGAVALAQAALRGGCRIVQYRAKGAWSPEDARALRDAARSYGALFIVNDDWKLARTLEADGVHLGPEDVECAQLPSIRAALGEALIGFSCGTAQEMEAAARAQLDYAGVGSVFATASKADAGEPIGVDGLRRVAAAAPLPVAAIGGITAENMHEIRAAGVAMAAVLSALSKAHDPQAAMAGLVAEWNAR